MQESLTYLGSCDLCTDGSESSCSSGIEAGARVDIGAYLLLALILDLDKDLVHLVTADKDLYEVN